jgi:N-acetylmuramoyl-L-alanine amidase
VKFSNTVLDSISRTPFLLTDAHLPGCSRFLLTRQHLPGCSRFYTVFFLCLALVTTFCSSLAGNAPKLEPPRIVQRPIPFTALRRKLTLEYIRTHDDPTATNINITPRVIVAHWTNTKTLAATLAMFKPAVLSGSRTDIQRGGRLNVSAQFVVDRDGTIYQLMDDTLMARHTIGLNRVAIGIENVGGGAGFPLNKVQAQADAALVRYLVGKHPTIRYLIGHLESLRFRGTPLWRERDSTYYTVKSDPGADFMSRLRALVMDLKLEGPP